MEKSIEDAVESFVLDSGDSVKVSTVKIEDFQELFSAVFECNSCNTSADEEMSPCVDEKKSENKKSCEQLETSVITTNAFSATDENIEKAGLMTGEKQIAKHSDSKNDDTETLISPQMAKKSAKEKEDRTRKKVHFKSEVETVTYEPRLSIWENYNYTEEFSVENLFADVFNEKRTLPGGINRGPWKSEINLAAYSRPCNQCSIMEEWVRCEHGFRRLKKDHILNRHYTRLNDEDIGLSSKKVKPILKRSGSCLITKKEIESENAPPGGNLKRRLSMSMHNLKIGMESLTSKFKVKVTKKKKDTVRKPLWFHAGNITDAPMEELKNLTLLKRTDSLLGKEKGVGENETLCGMPGNAGLRRSMSMYTLKKEKFSILESSEFTAENSSNDPEKAWARMKRKVSSFRKKKRGVDKESSVMCTKPGPRSWMSMQNLSIDSKSLLSKL